MADLIFRSSITKKAIYGGGTYSIPALSAVTDSNGTANTIADDAAPGTVVGITALASMTGQGVTYELTNSAGGKYAINSTTGVITVGLVALAAGTDTITVRATGGGMRRTKSFTITVTASGGTVDAFSFTDFYGVKTSSTYTSHSIFVTNLTGAGGISITGGTYSINGATFTSSPGTVVEGDKVCVSCSSSASLDTVTSATLTIADKSDTFTLRTIKAPTLYVATTGNDTTGNGTSGNPYLTIQKAISIARAGDVIQVAAGTYVENSTTSPYTTGGYWTGGQVASICADYDGTATNPIVITAAPGSENAVIIDGQNARMGIYTRGKDYHVIHGIRFINMIVMALGFEGQPSNRVADPSLLCTGWRVEGCQIYTVDGNPGANTAGIHMWGSKDWVVRNNNIDNITISGAPASSHTAGVDAYGTINALVEKNTLTNTSVGILWKDHFSADAQGTPLFESEIRYNKIKGTVNGVNIQLMGGGTEEAGKNYIHHNIFNVYTGQGIVCDMYEAPRQSTGLIVENNIFDGVGSGTSYAISNNAYIQHKMKGNVFVRNQVDIRLVKLSATVYPNLDYSNYNAFETSSVFVQMDRYAATQVDYTSLTAWKAALNSATYSLNFDYPDANSFESTTSAMFTDIATGDYTPKAGTSPLLGAMPDGTNIGVYQTGSESIGSTV